MVLDAPRKVDQRTAAAMHPLLRPGQDLYVLGGLRGRNRRVMIAQVRDRRTGNVEHVDILYEQ